FHIPRSGVVAHQSCPKCAKRIVRVLLPRGEGRPARSPSPLGRRLKKGPDEGRSLALTRPFAAPPPGGRGTPRQPVSLIGERLQTASSLDFNRFAKPNWDRSDRSRTMVENAFRNWACE